MLIHYLQDAHELLVQLLQAFESGFCELQRCSRPVFHPSNCLNVGCAHKRLALFPYFTLRIRKIRLLSVEFSFARASRICTVCLVSGFDAVDSGPLFSVDRSRSSYRPAARTSTSTRFCTRTCTRRALQWGPSWWWGLHLRPEAGPRLSASTASRPAAASVPSPHRDSQLMSNVPSLRTPGWRCQSLVPSNFVHFVVDLVEELK